MDPQESSTQAARESARVATARVAEQAGRIASAQKSRVASAMGDVGAALREASRALRERRGESAASWTDAIADQAEGFAGYLERSDLRGLSSSIESFARRRPEIALPTMFLAGLGLARFLKASAHRAEPEATGEESDFADELAGDASTAPIVSDASSREMSDELTDELEEPA